jgi:hypothetical protein
VSKIIARRAWQGVDRSDAGQVAEPGLVVAGQHEAAALGGMRGDDEIMGAARGA